MSNLLPQHSQYMLQQVANAVEILVTHPGNILARLASAGDELVRISKKQVPLELQPSFQEIIDYLTEYKGSQNSSWPLNSDVHVTMKRRRSNTAIKTAEKIWSFYHAYKDTLHKEYFP